MNVIVFKIFYSPDIRVLAGLMVTLFGLISLLLIPGCEHFDPAVIFPPSPLEENRPAPFVPSSGSIHSYHAH